MSIGYSFSDGHTDVERELPDHARTPAREKAVGAERFALCLRTLWSARAAIILITAIATAAGVGWSFLIPPRYEATTRLLPAPPSVLTDGAMQTMRPELGALAGLAAIPDGNDRFIALLKSRVVADRIISRFSLMRLYSTRYRHEARTALAKHTTIQEDRKSGVITLIFSDRSPELAAQIAQAYVRELERLNAELNTSGAHLERQFLEERVKEVDQQLHEATSRLSDFSTSSGMLDPQQQPKTTVDEALKLEAQIVSLKAELSGQEQIYSPETLRVPRARLAELEQHLAQLQGTHAARPLDGLDGSFPSIRKLPKSSAAFLEFSRQVKLLEAVQMYLTQKLELAKTEEVKQLPAVRVMEPAEIPEQRVWPKRTEIVLAAFTFGLFAAATLVFGKAKWQATEADHPMKALLIDALGRNSTSLRQFGA